jgi:hypothetical protein
MRPAPPLDREEGAVDPDRSLWRPEARRILDHLLISGRVVDFHTDARSTMVTLRVGPLFKSLVIDNRALEGVAISRDRWMRILLPKRLLDGGNKVPALREVAVGTFRLCGRQRCQRPR